MQLNEQTQNTLLLHFLRQNMTTLIHFFTNKTSDLNGLEDALGSIQFNDLRSHVIACRLDYNGYLKLLDDKAKQELANEANIAVGIINECFS